ncbi:YegP family protein [Methylobacterium sp. Leaf118]|uniref:YegP family protein n=1 Tax=Methylobacterium sp. Leaf118 TaxID=2876562 RepID=UPI001E304E7C|nr:YegP family protein [Methylobacterium sp. Leaf118]
MSVQTYPCYKQQKDNKDQWYWVYYAKNGEKIARSSESYVSRSDCEHSIKLIKVSGNDPVYTV